MWTPLTIEKLEQILEKGYLLDIYPNEEKETEDVYLTLPLSDDGFYFIIEKDINNTNKLDLVGEGYITDTKRLSIRQDLTPEEWAESLKDINLDNNEKIEIFDTTKEEIEETLIKEYIEKIKNKK